MKASERALTLTRSFNMREGFTATDDALPERLYEGIKFGPSTGAKIDREQFQNALRLYYQMMGWNPETGVPSVAKLLELDLGWINDSESKPRSATV
jgi:aldehyde:ferredoxin oxidoreductase